MPKSAKQKSQQPQQNEPDYEQSLIDKVSKCERIVNELKGNVIWDEIRADYENTSKGLDLAWAFEEPTSPRFKQMQVTKLAAQTFINLLPTYENDLKMAKKELEILRSPGTEIKKDYDDEGVEKQPITINATPISINSSNAYHGKE